MIIIALAETQERLTRSSEANQAVSRWQEKGKREVEEAAATAGGERQHKQHEEECAVWKPARSELMGRKKKR